VRGDGRVGFGVARGFAVVCDWRSDAGGTPTTKPLTNLQNLEFHNKRLGYGRVVVHPSVAVAVRSGTRKIKNPSITVRSGNAENKFSPCVAVMPKIN